MGIQGCGPGRKKREAGGRMTLTRLFLPFGRLQKEGPRRTEANTNEAIKIVRLLRERRKHRAREGYFYLLWSILFSSDSLVQTKAKNQASSHFPFLLSSSRTG